MHREPSTARYTFVDALRGIAALGVLLYHLLHNTFGLEGALNSALPKPLTLLCDLGEQGVQVFFVISGFVIAHSLRRFRCTPREIVEFMLKRQVRLDLPYWTMIAVGAALWPRLNPGAGPSSTITAQDLVLNTFYLQHIFGAAEVVRVGWTLCLEIQFYILFILCLALARLSPGSHRPQHPSRLSVGAICGLGLLSLCFSGNQWVFGAWFLPFWSYFAAGALCYWAVERRIPPSLFWSFALLFAGAAPWFHKRGMITGFTIVVVLYAVGRTGHLTDWLAQRPFRYFGRLSYSLYLVHLPVLATVLGYGYRHTGEATAPALGWFMLAGVASIAAAHVLHTVVESPSMMLARRIVGRQPEPVSTRHQEVVLS